MIVRLLLATALENNNSISLLNFPFTKLAMLRNRFNQILLNKNQILHNEPDSLVLSRAFNFKLYVTFPS